MTHSPNDGMSLEDMLTSTGKKKVRAILFTIQPRSPFGVLATDIDFDLGIFIEPTRGIPQYIPPVQPDDIPALFDDREVVDTRQDRTQPNTPNLSLIHI